MRTLLALLFAVNYSLPYTIDSGLYYKNTHPEHKYIEFKRDYFNMTKNLIFSDSDKLDKYWFACYRLTINF